jgi:cysteine synthase A
MKETPPPPPALAESVLDTIGNTPLVDAHHCLEALGLSGRLLVKLEYCNPGGSKKDRVALEIIRRAKADGDLRDGQTVVELTSGNTGTGLALVCRALGHPFVAVMSRGNTPERVAHMCALGADVVLVDQAEGSTPGQVSGIDLELVHQRTTQLVVERGAFRSDQFVRPACALAHELYTGEELWTQSGGAVDAFVDCVGTGGTFAGVMRCLRRHNPSIRGYVVEPAGAAVLAGRPVMNPSHVIQGAGYMKTDLPLLDRSLVSDYLQVGDDETIAGARRLAALDGIFGGYSTGANFAAAVQLLAGRERGKTVVLLACDHGVKYMSTGLYSTHV